ncbi:MAG: YggS family pyridoxal phosphate-dependent enzyme [Chloroflexi bacterium]|nr:MAG: YggS family pyridoxal phosphate-dependent enzyme [Chloroflexota bacterium]
MAAVRERIAAAASRAGRDPASVRLVAVTKGVDADRINEAIAAGVDDVGENRVQEAVRKHAAVNAGVRWHMVGHLQTNKARRAAELFQVVHSVDSARVGEALAAGRPHQLGPLEVLVEVDLTGIPGRSGASPQTLTGVVSAVRALPGIRLTGLMTIAPQVDQPDAARPWFAQLRRLRDDLEQTLGAPIPELSMGMSDDFEVAVEEGATVARVGRAIFAPGMV